MVGVSTYAAVVVLQLATVVNDLRKEMNDIGRLDADKGSQISKTTKKAARYILFLSLFVKCHQSKRQGYARWLSYQRSGHHRTHNSMAV